MIVKKGSNWNKFKGKLTAENFGKVHWTCLGSSPVFYLSRHVPDPKWRQTCFYKHNKMLLLKYHDLKS